MNLASALDSVRKNGRALENVLEKLRTREVCMAAVKQDGWALKFVPEHLRTFEMCMVAVKGDGIALKFVPQELRTEEMCIKAVKRCGFALNYVPEKLRTKELSMEAVKQDGYVLRYVSNHLKTAEFCMKAVQLNGWSLSYVPEELKTAKICLEAVKQGGWTLEYVPEHLKTVELCRIALYGADLKLIHNPFTEELIKSYINVSIEQVDKAPQCLYDTPLSAYQQERLKNGGIVSTSIKHPSNGKPVYVEIYIDPILKKVQVTEGRSDKQLSFIQKNETKKDEVAVINKPQLDKGRPKGMKL